MHLPLNLTANSLISSAHLIQEINEHDDDKTGRSSTELEDIPGKVNKQAY